MIDFDYLSKGLNALARAHQVNTMSGHLGAAVIAGYFVGEQHPDLDAKVSLGIEAELNRIISGESVFSPKKDAGINARAMFEPFAKQEAKESLIDGIADALFKNMNRLRASGHNVIFASIAIRALKDHPEFATPAIIDGIRKLIEGFDQASPGSGYYGKEKGRVGGNQVKLSDKDGIKPFNDLTTVAERVADLLIRDCAKRREGFGGLWHVIDHACALAELSRYGYRKLAIKGLPAFTRHFRLLQTLPDIAAEKGAESPTEFAPLDPRFWVPEKIKRERAHLTHRIKTLYGFEELIQLLDNETKSAQATDRLRYLM